MVSHPGCFPSADLASDPGKRSTLPTGATGADGMIRAALFPWGKTLTRIFRTAA